MSLRQQSAAFVLPSGLIVRHDGELIGVIDGVYDDSMA